MFSSVFKPSLAAAILASVVLTGCPSGEEPPVVTCELDGKVHKAGEGFTAPDGCNSCQCMPDGNAACTLVDCIEPGEPGGCSHGNRQFSVGDSFPADDGCNTCSCTSSGVACTEKACLPNTGACVRGGCSGQLCGEKADELVSDCAFRQEYACFAKAKCERQPNGKCGHTPSPDLDACLEDTGELCAYNGEWHRAGTSFPSMDGCNTCSCGESGAVACTKRACVPDQPKACKRTGCSGQLCAEEELASTCEFRPEYACYQAATCERQKNGQCGFTPTKALVQCLAGHGACQVGDQTYKLGESFPSSDGCNSCVCTDVGTACTLKACLP